MLALLGLEPAVLPATGIPNWCKSSSRSRGTGAAETCASCVKHGGKQQQPRALTSAWRAASVAATARPFSTQAFLASSFRHSSACGNHGTHMCWPGRTKCVRVHAAQHPGEARELQARKLSTGPASIWCHKPAMPQILSNTFATHAAPAEAHAVAQSLTQGGSRRAGRNQESSTSRPSPSRQTGRRTSRQRLKARQSAAQAAQDLMV